MKIMRFVPVCNCKSCQHSGKRKYKNGMHQCDVTGVRESLGHICNYYKRREPSNGN